MNKEEIIKELKKHASERNRRGMARFGINPKYALGVNIPVLRKIAKKTGKNHKLAKELWKTKIHEVRILASMVEDPKKVTEKQMDSWIKEFNSWDLCDQCCMNLFDKMPFVYEKAIKLTKEKKEFTKRAGFALIATLTNHDKTAPDSKFIKFLPIIKKESIDERNFVKKAVNWALRNIGKRNKNLRKHAINTAEEIQKIDSKSAKWIAADAIRELRSRK